MACNLRLLFIFIFIICQLKSGLLYSQSDDYIEGKIINSTTSAPVPFATIKLKYNQLGVYANADGDFKVGIGERITKIRI